MFEYLKHRIIFSKISIYQIHSPATTYVCEICLEKFFTPASLDVHKVWEHSVPPRDDALQKLVGTL